MFAGPFIINPLKEYKSWYLPAFQRAIDEVVEADGRLSGVDLELNRQQMQGLEECLDERTRNFDKMSLLWARLILGEALILGTGVVLWEIIEEADLYEAFFLPIVPFCFAGCIFLLWRLVPEMIRQYKALAGITEEVKALEKEAADKLRPLADRLIGENYLKIALDVIPAIQPVPFLTEGRYRYLAETFGYERLNSRENESVIELLSGDLGATPFVLVRHTNCRMEPFTYTGRKNISWTEAEEYTDENGKKCIRDTVKTQELIAEVIELCPVYRTDFQLDVMSDRAASLDFFRKPPLFPSSKGKVDHGSITTESLRRELNFKKVTGDEVEFGVMFNEMTLSSLRDLQNDREYGFGDDFFLAKTGSVLKVTSRHLDRFSLKTKGGVVSNGQCNYEKIKNEFKERGEQYFRNFYFTFAPVLAIGLYQRFEPTVSMSAKYRNDLSGLSIAEMEHIVNEFFGYDKCICKIRSFSRRYSCEEIRVDIHTYTCERHTAEIPKWGDDGKMHDVTVHYDVYTPKVDEKKVFVRSGMKKTTTEMLRKAELPFLKRRWRLDQLSGILSFQAESYSEEDDRVLSELIAKENK